MTKYKKQVSDPRGFARGASPLMIASALLLSACAGDGKPSSQTLAFLAPAPPSSYQATIDGAQRLAMAPDAAALAEIAPAAGYDGVESQVVSVSNSARESRQSACRIDAGFASDSALAYRWGEKGKNRLGLDVGDSGMDAVKLQYALRLQPPQKAGRKCLYNSQWQGLAGAVLN